MNKTSESLSPGKDQRNLLIRLKDAQKRFGYIPQEFMAELAESLGVSISEVYGVATFYSLLSTRQQGRHIIRLCKSLPCYLNNAEMIINQVEQEIGIGPGETTADGKFSFELTNCIGACDQAPAMMMDNEIYGDLTPEKISQILKDSE